MRILAGMWYRVWLYKKRHYIATLMQIFIPALILFVMASLNSSLFSKKVFKSATTRYPLMTESDLYQTLKYPHKKGIVDTTLNRRSRVTYHLGSGNNTLLRKIIAKLGGRLNGYIELVQVQKEDEIIRWSMAHHHRNVEDQYLGGVVLSYNPGKDDKANLKVRIRMARYIPNKWFTLDYTHLGDKTVVYYYPFMGLQLGIFQSYLEVIEDEIRSSGGDPSKEKPLQIRAQGFPYPSHEVYKSRSGLETQQYLTISIALGMTFLVFTIIRAPCTDKESRFKIYLHCMGIPTWIYWIHWILIDIAVQLVSISFQIVLLFCDFFHFNTNMGAIVKRGNIVIWTLFLVLYSFAAVSFCSFIAAFSKRGLLASYTGATIWLLSYYYSDIFLRASIMNTYFFMQIVLFLIPNAALIFGVRVMLSNAGGIQWADVLNSGNEDLPPLLLIPSLMLIFDTLFYYFLALYTDKIRPGNTHGRPWYYRLLCVCRCLRRKPVQKLSFSPEDGDDEFDYHVLEGNHVQENPFMQIFQLSKGYIGSPGALTKMNLRFREGQRTCVVGHHGSGKTTLIEILCGAINADSGTILIDNLNIQKDRSKVNKFMSVCMCEDNFSNDTSIIDHLILVGILKGMSHKEAKLQGIEYLEELELFRKRNQYPERLLQFERRKLSLSMAFMGNCKFVLIDGPTVGVEDEMKQGFWDFILRHSVGRTMLIATSSVDEAYYLGTKVAIMSLGKIVVSGSRTQLEEIFSTGYHLKITMRSDANATKIEQFVQQYITTSDTLDSNAKRIKRAMSVVDMDVLEPTEPAANVPGPGFLARMRNRISDLLERTSIYYDAVEKQSPGPGSDPIIDEVLESYEKEDVSIKDSKTFVERNFLRIQLPMAEGPAFSKLFQVLEEDKALDRFGILSWSVCRYDMDDAFYEVNRFIQLLQARRYSVDVKEHETAEKYFHEMTEVFEKSKCANVALETINCTYLHLLRFRASFLKRIFWLYGNWAHLFVQVVPAILLLIVTVLGTNYLFESMVEKMIVDHKINEFSRLVALIKNPAKSTFSKTYLSAFKPDQVKQVNNFAGLLKDVLEADTKYVLGVDIGLSYITAMFSSTAFHSAPTSLTVLFNAYLKYRFDGSYRVSSDSYPVQPRKSEILKYYDVKNEQRVRVISDEAVQFSIGISFGFFIFISGFVKQPLSEKIWGLKRLQSNLSPRGYFTYWITFFLTDLILTMALSAILLVILAYMPSHEAFRNPVFETYFLLFCLLSAYTILIWVYIGSFVLIRVKTSHFAVLSFNQFTGLFFFIFTITMEGITGRVMSYVGRLLFPAYCVTSGFYSLIYYAIDNGRCSLLSPRLVQTLCKDLFPNLDQILPQKPPRNQEPCCMKACLQDQVCGDQKDYLKYNFEEDIYGQGLWLDGTALLGHVVVGSFILYFLELERLRFHLYQSGIKKPKSPGPGKHRLSMDKKSLYEGAMQLRNHLVDIREQSELNPQNLYIACLSKKIGRRSILENITLVARPGEVLLVLGPKGSGKTTLLSILTHFKGPSSGDAFYNNLSLFSAKECRKLTPLIGYCPADLRGFSENYSGKQFLKFFGRMRGLPEKDLNEHVTKWLTLLRLGKRSGAYIETYSNSLKRKLLIAATLIGDPPILLFDNPVKDLNPITKSHFWKIIRYLATECKRVVVIAASSPDEEIEENCDQLAFLINGKIETLMTPAEYKDEYGLGYTVFIRCKQEESIDFKDYSKLKSQIQDDLPDCELRDEKSNSLKFFVPNTDLRWSALFTKLENIKQTHEKIMEAYTVRETTLYDIYQSFAVKQTEYTPSKTSFELFCSQYC